MWTFEDWKTCLEIVTNNIRLKYCLETNSSIQYMRSVPGHLGRQQIDRRVQNNVLNPYGWSDHQSIWEGVLIAGGIGFREDERNASAQQSIPW